MSRVGGDTNPGGTPWAVSPPPKSDSYQIIYTKACPSPPVGGEGLGWGQRFGYFSHVEKKFLFFPVF
jgi:hypothetical protein